MTSHEPFLLQATAFPEKEIGSFEWDPDHNSEFLTVSNGGRTIEWRPRKPEGEGKSQPPAWVPASTRSYLHSGKFQWDFLVEEMATAQIGIGFMLLWNIGPDWGLFGYLGSSDTAWSYDPSTGDVVYATQSIQGGLPIFTDRRTGIVSVHLDLPRYSEGTARFSINGINTQPIPLPEGAVILPAACFLKETQKVTLGRLQQT